MSLLRTITSIAFAVLLIAPPLLAQDTSVSVAVVPLNPPPHRAATPRGTLRGTVLLSDTRGPARDALVTLTQIPKPGAHHDENLQPMARTAFDGTFIIHNVPEGDYGIAAEMPGYLSTFDNSPSGSGASVQRSELTKAFAASGIVSVRANQTT